MTRLLVLMSIFLVLGCATQLTPEGSSVRLVSDNAECDFVGTVSGSNSMGSSTAHDADGAMNDLRNKAAVMGANAVKIINVDSDSEATTAVAEALDCDFD
jgi:uncharacterized protein YbjQ (UPF0145 family)